MNVEAQPFASAEEFLHAYDASQSGCLVVDMRMLGMSGLELQEKLASDRSELPVIIISAYVQINHAVIAMKAGAETVLAKPYHDQELWDAIQAALQRDAASRQRALYNRGLRSRFATLTDPECEVLDLVASGKPNKVVASTLRISLRTVEDRRQNIMRKLGVESFAQLVEFVIELRHLSDSAHWCDTPN